MLRRLAKLAGAVDLRDLLAIAGLALLTYGAYLLSRPAGLIVAGAGLWYLGAWHTVVLDLMASRAYDRFNAERTTDSS